MAASASDPSRVSLEEVLCTEELRRRPARQADHAAENKALSAIARAMAQSPHNILQELVDNALELCHADSTGISILESDGRKDVFRWHAVAGHFRACKGLAIPRTRSPCGTVLDRDATLLFTRPERHFRSSFALDRPVVETLLVPFYANGRPVGTVWAVSHRDERRFDREDARLLESISQFAAAAYQMINAFQEAENGRVELERRVAERTVELSDTLNTLRLVAGGVAHELRNPLNVVKTSIFYLNSSPKISAEKREEHMQRIQRNLARTEEVISTLTDHIRVRDPDMQPISIRNCVHEVLADVKVPERIQLELSLPTDLPRALADQAQLRIVLSNLIRNAVEAMPSAGKLLVAARANSSGIEIDVSDNGVGIAAADLKRVTQPLYSTKSMGMGIG